MAQSGTPTAGWYADPSGQHQARFWDGACWTEQIRDDLGEPLPHEAPHAAAATVAGVAAAVAAVAAADVPPSGVATADLAGSGVGGPFAAGTAAEGSFVVDYGTDPWDAASAAAPVVEPAVAPVVEPAGGFGADPWGGAPVVEPAGVFGADPWGGASAVDPVAQPVLEPATEPAVDLAASVAAPFPPGAAPGVPFPPGADAAAGWAKEASAAPPGPPAGWYPDPALRHEARFWDGACWTYRVADHGVEGSDPVPGTSPAVGTMPTALDPAEGGWTAQLVGTAPDTAAPDGAGGYLSAGQASLATLPAVDPDADAPPRERRRVSGKVRAAGGVVVGGAALMLIGSRLTWMEVRGPKVGDAYTSSGVDLGDGRVTMVLAVALVILGAVILTGRFVRMGGPKVAAMGAIVAGAAALAVTAVDIADVADRAERLGVPLGAVTDVGTGLWLAFVGSLLAVVGGLLAFANRR